MKRLNYLSDERRISSFTFDDNATGNVVIVVESGHDDVIKRNTISIPLEHLDKFIQSYKNVTDTVKFAGLIGWHKYTRLYNIRITSLQCLDGGIGSNGINKIMPYILYKTTNIINGKFYVGVSNGNNPSYKGSGTALLEAIKIYGSKNFKREILEVFDAEETAFHREAEIVNELFVKNRDTYNIKVGGKGGTGQLKTTEHRKKISEKIKENFVNGKVKNNGKNAGRKSAMNNELLISMVDKFGIIDTSKKLNLTYYQCRDRYYRAKTKLKNSWLLDFINL